MSDDKEKHPKTERVIRQIPSVLLDREKFIEAAEKALGKKIVALRVDKVVKPVSALRETPFVEFDLEGDTSLRLEGWYSQPGNDSVHVSINNKALGCWVPPREPGSDWTPSSAGRIGVDGEWKME
jgi:hypothetical protein